MDHESIVEPLDEETVVFSCGKKLDSTLLAFKQHCDYRESIVYLLGAERYARTLRLAHGADVIYVSRSMFYSKLLFFGSQKTESAMAITPDPILREITRTLWKYLLTSLTVSWMTRDGRLAAVLASA